MRPKNLARRPALQTILSTTATCLGGTIIMPDHAQASPTTRTSIDQIIKALRATNNPNCLAAANQLEARNPSAQTYNLHLRNANLTSSDADLIATAIHQSSQHRGPKLQSFSMSYNPGLTAANIETLTKYFPTSLTDLGMVRCAITDIGGTALLIWSQRAAQLRMICIEQNDFSPELRANFRELGRSKPNLTVII